MRLFWKVFLVLLLTLFLTAGLSTWLSRSWLRDQQYIEHRFEELSRLGHTALVLYQQGGRKGYRQWLHERMQHQHFRGMLVDAYGKAVLKRRVPQEFQELIRQAIRNNKAVYQAHPPMLAVVVPEHIGGKVYYWLAISRLPAHALQNQQSMRWLRLSLAFLSLILISFVLTRMFTRPIAKLQVQLDKFGQGQLSSRCERELSNRHDELGDLARSVDSMAERLQALLHSHKQLLRDISHELRSPLARLRVALELTRNTAGACAADELERIEKEAEQLNALIEEVLILARFEQGVVVQRKQKVSLAECIRTLVEDADFEAVSMGKGVCFEVLQNCSMYADKRWLMRALDNVIRNAVHHCQSLVRVSLSCRGGVACIDVCDDGDGVNEEALSHLFEAFFRESTAREHVKHGGHGLGLAIARQVVVAHRGEIMARNIQPRGLQVLVRLPLE